MKYGLTALFSLFPALADVGIIVYETKGLDARRTSSGHIALVATNLCAQGIEALRACRDDEPRGAVVNRYATIAPLYTKTMIVLPLQDHLTGTSDRRSVPVATSGGTLEAIQIEYWRNHLRAALPPLTIAQYEALVAEENRFDAGRTFRRALQFDFIGKLAAPPAKHYPTEPFALIDPTNQELIPNGRWREAVGALHSRAGIMITAIATPQQEQRLIEFLSGSLEVEPFHALANNCSDFVKRALVAVFEESSPKFRTRAMAVADAWITSPISVTTDFVALIKKAKLESTVSYLPILGGTRRHTLGITTLSRGALVPNPGVSKLAFGLKIYINTLNPLLGATALAVDKLSMNVDLPKLVHERGSVELSRAALDDAPEAKKKMEKLREQFRAFGTKPCWEQKKKAFSALASWAKETNLFDDEEAKQILKTGRPFELARIWERRAAALGKQGDLVAGIQTCISLECRIPDLEAASSNSWKPAKVPSRDEVTQLADSRNHDDRALAFRLMSVPVNYDLSAPAQKRRLSPEFDLDWKMLLEIARKNGYAVPIDGSLSETIADCACRRLDAGLDKADVFGLESSIGARIAQGFRDIWASPSR